MGWRLRRSLHSFNSSFFPYSLHVHPTALNARNGSTPGQPCLTLDPSPSYPTVSLVLVLAVSFCILSSSRDEQCKCFANRFLEMQSCELHLVMVLEIFTERNRVTMLLPCYITTSTTCSLYDRNWQ